MKKKLSSLQKALNIWAIILIFWSIYRTKFSLPIHIEEFILKPLVFVLPVYIYITRFEKKDFFSSIWLSKRNLSSNILFSIIVGFIFTATAFIAHYSKTQSFSFKSTIFASSSHSLIAVIMMALFTGISEEILSRGFILKKIYEDSKNIYSSAFLASVLFLILHVPILFTNLKLQGNALLLFLATDFVLSIINSLIFIERKNLIPPILIHAFYNLSVILYV